jgi:hypothetical protein
VVVYNHRICWAYEDRWPSAYGDKGEGDEEWGVQEGDEEVVDLENLLSSDDEEEEVVSSDDEEEEIEDF